MATLSETRPHGTGARVAPARTPRLALLLALAAAVVIGLTLGTERPTAPDGVHDPRVSPTSERTYDGRGKWTGY